MPRRLVTNWGNYPAIEANVTETSRLDEIRSLIETSENLITRGNGRCYGDSSLGENIFSSLRLNKFRSFDIEKGEIECESGIMLADILDVAIPRGFFLPVTPGTKFITVGGAIAADVHGKNHHRDGSFANHVVSFELLTEGGEVISCSPTLNADLFWQTCGGMGLTGVILSAKFRLKQIETAYIDHQSIKTKNLESTMKAFEKHAESTYSVAWLDCFAGNKQLGRSILQLGEHAKLESLNRQFAASPLLTASKKAIGIPFSMPAAALNYLTIKSFNFAYYHRQLAAEKRNTMHFDHFFYPLDGLQNWNRLYGRQGFVQYQFVLPLAKSFDGITDILEKVRLSGEGSPLAVLKLFGPAHPKAIMSFPMDGYTLALDFKANAKVFRLLDELDEIVMKNDGRIYLAKDARMQSEIFNRSYTRKVKTGYFQSSQALRLKI